MQKQFTEIKLCMDYEGKDICPVCRIRLKEESKDRCIRCQERYEKRARSWLDKNKRSKETIWIDEVADHNDRVALILGQFDLRKWLSGEYLDTFISQTFGSWRNENNSICGKLSINKIEDLEKQFESMFFKTLNDTQKELCKSFIGIKPEDFTKNFWEPIAERDAMGQAMNLTNNPDKAKYLIKLLFRKHPSPARIRRIWNTTEDFIKNILINNILSKHSYGEASSHVNLRNKRIQLIISPSPNIPIGSTIDIDIDGVRLSPVCVDKSKGIFITTTNLQILSNKGKTPEEISLWMKEKPIKVKKEGNIQWVGGYRITNVIPPNEAFQDYYPYIPIYNYPDQFMLLIPAYDALNIAQKMFEQYEVQFSKVMDRLPFHLGIIAFHRRTPLYIAMDAAKRLIKAFNTKTKTIKAKVESIDDTPENKHRKLTITPDQDFSLVPLQWQISYSTGDPNQEDEWHPYIRIENKPSDTGGYFFDYDGMGNYVVHIKGLKSNDCIKIETSYFKLIFLESALLIRRGYGMAFI
ncbi:CRISPR-associated protein Csx11 [Thermodesulfovibrio yellowstonii]|nr:CRISPR-associated protein Csx11 [Thermodesulfovibrio islandicus]